MIRNNKWKFIISSFIILIPMLFAIPVKNNGGIFAQGFVNIFFVIPLLLLASHILCMILESRLQKHHEQNTKIVNLIFFILPTISIYINTLMFAIAMGLEFSISVFIAPLLGVMFIVIGNYMPKARQNRTFGVKIKWTLESEENWNATHRFAGKLWVVIGVLMLLAAFLPEKLFIATFFVIILVTVVPPTIYSYRFYKKQLASGKVQVIEKKTNKKIIVFSIIGAIILIAILVVVMFTGKLNFTLEQEKLVIDASFGGGREINYLDIESIEYREDRIDGTRVSGFASAKLLYGWFKNDEFGNHLRYTYAKHDAVIVMVVDGEEIVIADKDNEITKALYDAIIERIK